MGLKITRVGAALGVVTLLVSFSATLVIISTLVRSDIAFVAGAAVGTIVGMFTAWATSTNDQRQVRASWERQSAVIRELVRITVPAAVDLATDRDGRLNPDRFRDLIIASIAAASDPRLEFDITGPAVWEIDGRDARSPEQEQRLQRLLTYPSPGEARVLLTALAGMGPQTIHQFSTFAIRARSRLAVGLEGVLAGPAGAVLTGHLIAAGLVEQTDGPASAGGVLGPDEVFYVLSPAGKEVARLFAPITSRPQELAALDPAPVR